MKIKTTHNVVAPQKCLATGEMYVIGDTDVGPIGFKFDSPDEMVDFARDLLNMVGKGHDLTVRQNPKKGAKQIDTDVFMGVFQDKQAPMLKKFVPTEPPKATPMKKVTPIKKAKKGTKK